MAIPFRCANCGHSGRGRDGVAGRIVKCPKCQASVELPANGDRFALDVAEFMAEPVYEPVFREEEEADVLSPAEVKELDEAEWRAAMLEETRKTGEDLKNIRESVGCMWAVMVASLIVTILAALLSGV